MGIRFSCHLCNQPLHVKDYQAGKRGKCPKCQGSFRVPAKDADFSLAVEDSAAIAVTAKLTAQPKSTAQPKPTAKAQSIAPSSTVVASPANTSPATTSPLAVPLASQPSSSVKPSDSISGSVSGSESVAMPPSLLPLLDARWFVRPPSGGQYGPATTQMLIDWIMEKRVTADSLLWREGLDTWFAARELVPEPFGGQSSISSHPPADIPPPDVARTPHTLVSSIQSAASAQTTAPDGFTSIGMASNKLAIAMKKKKKLQQQWIVLGLLATMAFCLVVALIVILTRGS